MATVPTGHRYERGLHMRQTATASDGRQVQLSFRIDAALATALERVAADQDRTISAELRRLIRRHIAQVEQGQPAEGDA